MVFIVNNKGVPSVASFVKLTAPPTAPSAPTGVAATAGNASAIVTWNAPSDGGSPITKYTVTPYIGSTAQPQTTVSGSTTTATIGSLTNGTTYTFKVSATNGVGTSPDSSPSNSVTPTATPPGPSFVQKASAFAIAPSVAVTPSANVTAGNRLVVQAVVWSSDNATAASVTDSAGNQYVELTHFTASDHTEMSVWTAPITAGGGTRPTITVTPSTPSAGIGVVALEYAGLSTAAGTTVVDQQAHATGTTGTKSASVASGATAASTAANELAIGFYGDSGFGDTLTAGSGWTQRVNIGQTTAQQEHLVEDKLLTASGTTANATVTTGPSTPWLMATIIFKAPSAGGAATDIAAGTLAAAMRTVASSFGSSIASHRADLPARARRSYASTRRANQPAARRVRQFSAPARRVTVDRHLGSCGKRSGWKCRHERTIKQLLDNITGPKFWSGTLLHYYCRFGLLG
jgi:hypothetical protein